MNQKTVIERSMGLVGRDRRGHWRHCWRRHSRACGRGFLRPRGRARSRCFAANGAIAVLTALSFAEMSSAFSRIGRGLIPMQKKCCPCARLLRLAGWVGLRPLSQACSTPLGFASYAAIALQECGRLLFGAAPEWLGGNAVVTALAVGATACYAFGLIRKSAGGGNWINFWKNSGFCRVDHRGARGHSSEAVWGICARV